MHDPEAKTSKRRDKKALSETISTVLDMFSLQPTGIKRLENEII